PGTLNSLNHPFSPTPLGSDLFFSFGNNQDLPVVGLFDPPVASDAQVPTMTVSQVREIGTDVLHRNFGGGEVLGLLQLSVNSSPAQVASMLVHSAEAQNALVANLSQQYLGHGPDAAALASGQGGEQVVLAGILASQEYFVNHGGTTEAWVAALYRDVLHRQ